MSENTCGLLALLPGALPVTAGAGLPTAARPSASFPAGDTTRPLLQMRWPFKNQTFATAGSVRFEGTASDNVSLGRLELTLRSQTSGRWVDATGKFVDHAATITVPLVRSSPRLARWSYSFIPPASDNYQATIAQSRGFLDAWGLFAYAAGVTDATVQANVVSDCFAYGRRYDSGVNRKSEVKPPWWIAAASVNGGYCNDPTAACFDLAITKDGYRYQMPDEIAARLVPYGTTYTIIQFYRFVRGQKLTGAGTRFDCSSQRTGAPLDPADRGLLLQRLPDRRALDPPRGDRDQSSRGGERVGRGNPNS